MIGRNATHNSLLMAVASLTLVMAATAQEPASKEVLSLDQAIELARANNRENKVAKLDIDKQREASAEAKTSFYPRFDTYLLATELLTPLDFTIREGQLGTFPSTGPIPNSNVDLHTPARPVAVASITTLGTLGLLLLAACLVVAAVLFLRR